MGVIQVDKPKKIQQYIHRVGRTARYVNTGRGIIILLHSEKTEMLTAFSETKIPISFVKIELNANKTLTYILQSMISKNKELESLAWRAVASYIKSLNSVRTRRNSEISEITWINFARSYGLS